MRWRVCRGLRATGLLVSPGERSNRRLVIQAERPNRFRLFEGPISPENRGILSVVVYDGTTGWRLGNTVLGGDGLSEDPETRERANTAAARQNYINTLAGLLPVWLSGEGGVTFTALGAIADGPDRGAPALALTADGAPAGRLIFDPDTHLPRRLIVPYQVHIRPEGGEYTMTYSDYREVEGVRLPFRVAREGPSDQTTRWNFSAYVLNPTFEAGTFSRPTR